MPCALALSVKCARQMFCRCGCERAVPKGAGAVNNSPEWPFGRDHLEHGRDSPFVSQVAGHERDIRPQLREIPNELLGTVCLWPAPTGEQQPPYAMPRDKVARNET